MEHARGHGGELGRKIFWILGDKMLGGGRVVPEGVTPRLITLPITKEGIDDSALIALSERRHICYLEREFIPMSKEDGLMGLCLVYVELSKTLSEVVEASEKVKSQMDEAWEKHTQKEGRIPLSGEAHERARRLKQWRRETAEALKLPAYTIMHNSQLDQIAVLDPSDRRGA